MSNSQTPQSTNGHVDPHFLQNGTDLAIQSGEHALPAVDGAGPSNSVNGHPPEPYRMPHDERVVKHLYDVGFQMGEYADTLLHANQNTYRLHAIILARSPYFMRFLSSSGHSGGTHTIYVPLETYPEITDEGFAVALGYLYSSTSLSSLNTGNARAVLAAACLLGGMDDLCHYAYQACRNSITVDTINEWVDFVDKLPASDGSLTPSETARPTTLGPYAPQLRNEVFHFLVVELPAILDTHASPLVTSTSVQQPSQQNHSNGKSGQADEGRETLLRIFSRVPFDLFKAAVESPTFHIGSDQERFKFAKAAIDLRKRTRAHGTEETVVLAFGGGNSGSAVHITRKTRKRALFKVG